MPTPDGSSEPHISFRRLFVLDQRLMKSSELMVWAITVLAIVLVLVVNAIPASMYGDCRTDWRAACER